MPNPKLKATTATVKIAEVGNHYCTLPNGQDLLKDLAIADLSLEFMCPICDSIWRLVGIAEPPESREHQWSRIGGSSEEWRKGQREVLQGRLDDLKRKELDLFRAWEYEQNNPPVDRYRQKQRPRNLFTTYQPKEKEA